MSAIDSYRHTLLGVADCPSRFDFVPGRSHRTVPLYRLDEDATDASPDFVARAGDVLLGGGAGESAAFRVSIPEAITALTSHGPGDAQSWCAFGDGYVPRGWRPERSLPDGWPNTPPSTGRRPDPDRFPPARATGAGAPPRAGPTPGPESFAALSRARIPACFQTHYGSESGARTGGAVTITGSGGSGAG